MVYREVPRLRVYKTAKITKMQVNKYSWQSCYDIEKAHKFRVNKNTDCIIGRSNNFTLVTFQESNKNGAAPRNNHISNVINSNKRILSYIFLQDNKYFN